MKSQTSYFKKLNEKAANMGQGLLNFFSKAESKEGKLLEQHLDFKDMNRIKTECYYQTKHGKVKGFLSVNDKIIMYDPIPCEENKDFT